MSVRVVVVHPRDLAEPTSGGIQTFLRDFVAHSPSDFEITMAGVTTDTDERPIGATRTVSIGNNSARFMPIGIAGSLLRQPLTLPATLLALMRLRSELRHSGAILQLHRPYRHFLFSGHTGPRVQIIHLDLDAWPGPSGWRRLNWLYRDFDKDLERFDRVFVANEAGAQRLRIEHPAIAQRIVFLSGWYDDSIFKAPDLESRESIRGRLVAHTGVPGQSLGKKWVLFVGRLDPIKDPELAVDAFSEVARDDPEVRLMVVGDGEARDAMESRVKQTGLVERIFFLGELSRTSVADFMAASDVLLVSSIAEGGGPRVVLEALGSGLPVVSTVVGEVRRSVTTRSNGWLAEERMPAALAEGVQWTLTQPRNAMAAAAVAAARPFVASRVLQQLYDAYRELAPSG